MQLPVQEPLLFFSCHYPDLRFTTTKEGAAGNLETISHMLNQHLSRVALLQTLARKLSRQQHMVQDVQGNVVPWQRVRRHVQLDRRGREKSLEEKLARFGKAPVVPTAVMQQARS